MVSADPVSPELALVCPELRERALAALPPLPWEAYGRRTEYDQVPGRVVEALFHVAGLAVPLVVLALCSLLVTLGLTLLAGAVR